MNKKKYLQNLVNSYIKNTFSDKYDYSFLKTDEKSVYDIPNSLYKYMSFRKYTFEMLEKNYLYLAPAKKMDDQFDCSVNFSKDYILKLTDEEIRDEACIFYKDYLYKSKEINVSKSNKKFINDCIDLYSSSPTESKKKRYLLRKKYNIDDNRIDSTIDSVDKITQSIIEEKRVQKGLKKLFDIFRTQKKKTGLSSLTEVCDSQIMWQMYANNYKGICVEYDFSSWKNDGKKSNLMNVLPVIYLDKYNYDPMKLAVKAVLNIALFQKKEEEILANYLKKYFEVLTTKHKEWSLQKEWRYLGIPKVKVDAPRIKAIYMGKNIKKVDEEKIIAFATEHIIDIYKLKDNYQTLKIEFEKINVGN